MKKMKNTFRLMLAVAMIFMMSVTVFAAGAGTITIEDGDAGTVYKAYKVFDATYQGEFVSYTFTKDTEKLALYNALAGTESPFTLSPTLIENVYNVSMKEGTIEKPITASSVSAFLKSNVGLLGTGETKTATADAVGKVSATFSNLDYGYYYIEKTGTPGSTVGITSVAPSQTIKDKSANPGPVPGGTENPGGYKVLLNENGEVLKADENSANYGDTVKFILQALATNYEEGKKVVEYTAYDVLGEGFMDFQVTSVTVDGTEIFAPDYVYTPATSGQPATITIPWVDSANEHKYESPAVINIYCQAKVDTDAVLGNEQADANTTNIGWFNWKYDNGTEGPNTPNPTDPTVPPTEDYTKVTTEVYAVAIVKTDAKGNPLNGAQFNLGINDTNVPVKLVDAGSSTLPAVYEYDYAPVGEPNYTVVSPESGLILVKGLEHGEYDVRETVAPQGYNLISAPVTVTTTLLESSSKTFTLYKDAEGNITTTVTTDTIPVNFNVNTAAINIVNVAGTQLPSTGGIGTTIFYIIGGLLAVSAAVLLVTKKRVSR